MKTNTKTLIGALRILSVDIQSDDGVANAVIAEAAYRLEELNNRLSCKECSGDMKPGIAIESTCTGKPDFPGGNVVTMSFGGPGKIIPVFKCCECGWSAS